MKLKLKMKSNIAFVNLDHIKDYIDKPNTILFIDKNVFDNWKDIIPKEAKYIVIETSEERKNLDVIRRLYQMVLKLDASRSTRFVGIGGGIITDMIGYLASTFMRGVHFSFIPTTLLAMVDAAIGGKNGENFMGYKNMIGTINQPKDIFICLDFLSTLPKEEVYSAFGEILKYGIGFDEETFDLLNNNTIKSIINNSNLLERIINKCISIKVDIVEKDEKETALNGRKLLNLGHTMGHALEKFYSENKQYSELKHHGYAVILGLYYIARFIEDETYKNQVIKLLNKYISEIGFEIEDIEQLYKDSIKYMINDKKKIDNHLVNFIIPISKGECKEKIIDINSL
jgi:3-dehydroquinate synthase